MADININIKIPGEHVALGFSAISAMVDVPILIKCDDLFDRGGGHIYINIPTKTGEESNKEFAERWICAAIKGFIRMYKLAEDTDRRDEEISELDSVSENVDENVVIPA